MMHTYYLRTTTGDPVPLERRRTELVWDNPTDMPADFEPMIFITDERGVPRPPFPLADAPHVPPGGDFRIDLPLQQRVQVSGTLIERHPVQGAATVELAGARYTLPLDALDLPDPYKGWEVKTITSTSPPAGAVLHDEIERPRARFYDTEPDRAADRAYGFLRHLRQHFPGGF